MGRRSGALLTGRSFDLLTKLCPFKIMGVSADISGDSRPCV